MKIHVRSTPAKIIVGQLGVTLVGAAFWLLRGGADAGLGALAGGGISVLLSVYFAIKVFARPDSDPQAMLGTFFRAEALKLVLAGQFASNEEVERFRREAEAAANLQHPNIVAIKEAVPGLDRALQLLDVVVEPAGHVGAYWRRRSRRFLV